MVIKTLERVSKNYYYIIRGDVNKEKLMKLRVSFMDRYNIKSISCVDGALAMKRFGNIRHINNSDKSSYNTRRWSC